MITARNDGLQTPQPLQPAPLIESLRHQIRKLETAGRATDAKKISTGCPELDQLLPDRGLVTGTITEWLTPAGGCGAELLSLLAAREACADGGALVVVDPEHRFHPAAAAAWGVDLEKVIVLRNGECGMRNAESAPTSFRIPHSTFRIPSLLWAIDQSLRCPAVAAVWGRLGHVSERWLRRFQLSAEQSGAMGMFARPASVKGQPGWSEVQFEVKEKLEIGSRKSEGRTSGFRPQISDSRFQISNLRSQNSDSGSHLESQISNLESNLPNSEFRIPNSSFDRYLTLRLLRVRSGHAPIQPITLQIDFTTGKVQTVTKFHEQTVERQSGKRSPHSVRLASQLAHPKTGGRRQRA